MNPVLGAACVQGLFEWPALGLSLAVLLYGLAAVAVIALVAPSGRTGWQQLVQPGPRGARARVALPWLGWLAAATLTLQCHLAWRWLAEVGPLPLVALEFAVCSVVLLRLVWGAGARVGLWVAAALVDRGTPQDLPLAWSLGAALLTFAAPLAWGVALGDESGLGGFWGLWGALRR